MLFLVVASTWLLAGVVGRDPWKADEAYTYGLVLNIMETGDCVVPMLGGEPFVQKPPLMYITAAGLGKALGPLVGLETAMRLATVLFNSLTLLCLGLAGRELYGKGKGWLAPVLFMGCLGHFHELHMLITDVALVSGFAIALYGLAFARRRPWVAGLIAGTGIGVAFMSKGLLGPGLIGVTMALLFGFRSWRSKQYLIACAAAALAVLPWILIWPWLLWTRSPELFSTWLLDNNLGRFLGASGIGIANRLGLDDSRYNFFLAALWFAWPALPLGLWALWKEKGQALTAPTVQLPLLCLLVTLTVLTLSRNGRTLYALPALVPAALLGVRGFGWLSPGYARAVHGLCFGAFGLGLGALWLGWIAQMTGWPPIVWQRVHGAFPEFRPAFGLGAFLVALLFTVAWATWMWRQQRDARINTALNWLLGVTGVYLLLMTLWLPLAESNMSYRHLASLRQALPPGEHRIASTRLGEVQRAMFHYWAGVKTLRTELKQPGDCDLLLIQGDVRAVGGHQAPAGSWVLIWEQVHSQKELFRLFLRSVPASTVNHHD
jgi:4-amino-4-deoxy-L-arabinose transferase-like glycosyltransferase